MDDTPEEAFAVEEPVDPVEDDVDELVSEEPESDEVLEELDDGFGELEPVVVVAPEPVDFASRESFL